jgi:hypothetical protein
MGLEMISRHLLPNSLLSVPLRLRLTRTRRFRWTGLLLNLGLGCVFSGLKNGNGKVKLAPLVFSC